jgi:hypothetical protein
MLRSGAVRPGRATCVRGVANDLRVDAAEADPAANAGVTLSFALFAWLSEPWRATPIVATETPTAAKAARTHRI